MNDSYSFIELLKEASFHFADDTTREWGAAVRALEAAACIAVEAGYSDERIRELYASEEQLVNLDHVMVYVSRARAASNLAQHAHPRHQRPS